MNPLLRDSASGRDWRLATEEQRRAFCAIVRPVQMDEDTLLQALDTLVAGRSESLARLDLSDLVAMVLAADREAGS